MKKVSFTDADDDDALTGLCPEHESADHVAGQWHEGDRQLCYARGAGFRLHPDLRASGQGRPGRERTLSYSAGQSPGQYVLPACGHYLAAERRARHAHAHGGTDAQ